jgi:hypothetical protein
MEKNFKIKEYKTMKKTKTKAAQERLVVFLSHSYPFDFMNL